MGLESIRKGRIPGPRGQVIYGQHGIGKSTLAAGYPAPIFVTTEDGANDINCDKFPVAQTYDEFMDNLASVCDEPHEYETLVIDSLGWLETLIWAKVCEDRSVETIEDIGYAKGYTFAMKYWQQFFSALEEIKRTRGLYCVLIAHAKVEKFEDPSSDNYDRFTPALHKLASARVQQWADEVFFARYRVFTRKAGEDFNGNAKHKASSTDERLLYTSERASHMAKNRLAMPDEIPMSYSEIEQYLPKAAQSTGA